MGLTKQQLEALNDSSFPNNNAGYITPLILRDYNDAVISNTVNQDTYTADSASFDSRIDNIVAGTEYTTTASFNAYTQSTNAFTSSTNAFTSSTNNFTASYFVDSASFSSRIEAIDDDNVTTASFNQYTASNDIKVNNLNTISASYLSFTQSYYSDSASFDGRLDVTATTGSNTFNGNQIINGNVSASSFISASKFVGDGSQLTGVTASVSIAILDEGVYQGNATSLNFTGSGLTASVVAGVALIQAQIDQSILNQYTLTSSFNSFTQSYKTDSASFDSRINAVDVSSYVSTASFNAYTQSTNQFTASISTSVGLLQTFSASADSRYVQNSQTSSMAVSSSTYAVTSSYAVTATNASDILVYVKNTTGFQINKGKVVRITSAVGDNALIGTASWDNDSTSANTLGFVTENIANDAFGYVMTQGSLLGVNTDGFTAGQVLYLSASGDYTVLVPPAPYHEVRLGQVLRPQLNAGSIYVTIQNGYELSELHDINIVSASNNDLLAYNSASGQWENESFSTLGLATTSSVNALTQSINNNSSSIGLLQTFSGSEYKADSASFDSRIIAAENTGYVTTSSFNSYTSSQDFKNTTFATTGSNSFVGNQTVNGVVSISGTATYDLDITGGFQATAASRVSGSNGIANIQQTLVSVTSGSGILLQSFTGARGYMQVTGDGNIISIYARPSTIGGFSDGAAGGGFAVRSLTGNYYPIQFQSTASFTDGRVTFTTPISASAGITASLLEGYVWVGNSLNQNTQFSTSSFIQDLSSLNAFTASQFVSNSFFLTTGSNSITGSQIITGSLTITGSVAGNVVALSVASSTASIDFNLGSFFTLTLPTASVTYITGSNLKPGMTANIILTQQSTTGSVRFESSLFKFPSGSINTGSAVASAVDMVSVASVNGTTLFSVTARQLQ